MTDSRVTKEEVLRHLEQLEGAAKSGIQHFESRIALMQPDGVIFPAAVEGLSDRLEHCRQRLAVIEWLRRRVVSRYVVRPSISRYPPGKRQSRP